MEEGGGRQRELVWLPPANTALRTSSCSRGEEPWGGGGGGRAASG